MKNIHRTMSEFVRQYTDMDIFGLKIHCPYWMNKIKDGKVLVRGFEGGKGSFEQIRSEILRVLRYEKIDKIQFSEEILQKFARRNRIGIDCSGFAYRFLNELVRNQYKEVTILSLDTIFEGGISKTNVKRIIAPEFSNLVTAITTLQIGDLIATKARTHALVITSISDNIICYVHSSNRHTKEKGVHLGTIMVKEGKGDLSDQEWLELSSTGEQYNKKYFLPEKGDGVYRLKLFQ